jgi:Domain of unknown function (DUF4111)
MLPLIVRNVPITSLADALTAALAGDLVGLYAYGSVVSGGFDPGVSDLDLVAVTARDAVDLDLDVLDHVHRTFVADHPDWDDRLEVVYIGQGTLRDFRTSGADLAVISPGEPFHLSGPVRDWLQNWYLVRETGAAVAGKAAADVFPEIVLDEYLSAIAAYAGWLAAQNLEALPPGALAYAVISLCRALRTVRIRRPCTKQEGAEWAADIEPASASLIQTAWACRLSRGAIGLDDPATRTVAADFIRTHAEKIGPGR